MQEDPYISPTTMPNKHYTFYGCSLRYLPDLFYDYGVSKNAHAPAAVVRLVDNVFLTGLYSCKEIAELTYEQTYKL